MINNIRIISVVFYSGMIYISFLIECNRVYFFF